MTRIGNRYLKLALLAAFCSFVAPVSRATDLVWPGRSKNLGWPRPPEATKILQDRFANASREALGSADDIAAVKLAIISTRPGSEVKEIRWLSSTLVMAYVSSRDPGWFYVVDKSTGEWRVLIFYLLSIS
jgi:hypothetical protein